MYFKPHDTLLLCFYTYIHLDFSTHIFTFFITLNSSLRLEPSFWDYFPFTQRIPFDISFCVGLLVSNTCGICFSENVLILPTFLKDILT